MVRINIFISNLFYLTPINHCYFKGAGVYTKVSNFPNWINYVINNM